MNDGELVTMFLGQWLGGKHGARENTLDPALQAAIIKANEEHNIFSINNVPKMDDVISAVERSYWSTAFGVMKEWYPDEACFSNKLTLAAFLLWLELNKELEDVVQPVGISAACEKDLAAHGASTPKDIAKFEFAMLTGRWPSDEEAKSLVYGTPPQATAAGKAWAKAKMATIDSVLTASMTEPAHLDAFDLFVQAALENWSYSSDPFAVKASFIFNTWWVCVKRANNNDPHMTLAYVDQFRSLYAGRGIPVKHDTQIQASVASKRMSLMVTEKACSWGLGKPAPAENKIAEALDAMSKQMAEMMAFSMGSAARKGDGGGVPLEQRQCYHCGGFGHLIADCPKKA